jgi:superfamily II DNA or RNA helicase
MPVKLRPYQADLDRDTCNAWNNGAVDVGANSPTGSGKTVFFSHMIEKHPGGSIAVAHRQELVSQISVALARNAVRHRIIGSKAVAKNIVALHMADGGRSYYDPNARCAAAGIDTLIRMDASATDTQRLIAQTTLYVQDEAHHALRSNKWGVGRNMFPNARGLHVSATWVRADGAGLGRHADGFVDVLVNAPWMRDLIDMGYLTDYRIFTVQPSDLDLSGVDISSATGDFNAVQLRDATKASRRLVGDVVGHYLKFAPGKLGVTFAVDVEAATEIAIAFRAAGVPAEVVSAKTPDHLRMEILRRFKRREVMQLINVDLFGEGFDLPAIEVVSFARATESWSLYCQQFGRVLRLLIDPAQLAHWDSYDDATRRYFISISRKPHGIVIDHVGNVLRHMGPPDKRQQFTLDRRERRSSGKSDAIPYRTCLNLACLWPYERVRKCCPYCGHYPEPALRSAPEFVDGDLMELSPDVLAQMRGEIERIDGPARIPGNADYMVRMAINKRHVERQEAQAALRIAMDWYSGFEGQRGLASPSEKQRRFYLQFGLDVATAQALGAPDAEKLRGKICDYLLRHGIDGTVNPHVTLTQVN